VEGRGGIDEGGSFGLDVDGGGRRGFVVEAGGRRADEEAAGRGSYISSSSSSLDVGSTIVPSGFGYPPLFLLNGFSSFSTVFSFPLPLLLSEAWPGGAVGRSESGERPGWRRTGDSVRSMRGLLEEASAGLIEGSREEEAESAVEAAASTAVVGIGSAQEGEREGDSGKKLLIWPSISSETVQRSS
jgi:hypothetical protein